MANFIIAEWFHYITVEAILLSLDKLDFAKWDFY